MVSAPATRTAGKAKTYDTVTIRVDGTAYSLNLGDLTDVAVRRFRRETGYGPRGLFAQLQIDPDIDLLVEFIWLCRLAAGEDVELADCTTSYTNDIEFGAEPDPVGE